MKKTLAILALGLTAIAGHAATPLWMRDVQISPDGTEIAFCYKGDIYKVPAKGGTATQLTTQESYECTPIWSPDGKQIAFASDRYGNFDVFVMPADGGTAQRLTTHSTGEIPSTFTPDGKYILFSASIQDPASSALFPTSAMTELYKVPATGGRTEQVLGTPAEAVCFDKAGHQFLYQDRKGFEDEWRKHHISSITRDIWLYDAKTGTHTNLTDRAGEDRNPVLSPDGRTVYFLSERNGGSFNVYAFPLAQPREVKPITSFKTHPVRFLSMSDGGTLCYSYDGEIYTQQPDATPKKVAIELVRDDRPQFANLQSSDGATSAVVSPDGKQIAFTLRGEVFVTSADYATTKQVTHTPAREAGLSFATDNRTLAYASERGGNWQLYLAKIARKEDPNFPNATLIEEEVLLPSTTVERAYPQFSPDGKELAFIEDRIRLMVLNLETKKVRQITDGSTWYSTGGGFDYAWSPDGKWFTLEFTGNKHDPYSDIGLVSAEGGKDIINLTNSGYMSGYPHFALDGNAILFTTERYGMRAHASWGSLNDAMLVFLNQDAYDKYCLSKDRRRAERHRRPCGAPHPELFRHGQHHHLQGWRDTLLPGSLRRRLRPLEDEPPQEGNQTAAQDGCRMGRHAAGQGRQKPLPAGQPQDAENGHFIRCADPHHLPGRCQDGFGCGARIHVRPRVPPAAEAILQHLDARSGLGQDDRRLSPLPAPYRQ